MTLRRQATGAVLLEGALALAVLVPATLLSTEWARRGWVDVALVHAACAVARDVRWGMTARRAEGRVRPLLTAALGDRVPRADVERRRGGALTKLYLRAPLFLRFSVDGGERHHFEVTRRCLSP